MIQKLPRHISTELARQSFQHRYEKQGAEQIPDTHRLQTSHCTNLTSNICIHALDDTYSSLLNSKIGERGGSMIECWTLEREVGGLETYLRCVVSLSKALCSPKVLVIHRKRGLRPDMTEKLLTGTLILNTYKSTPKFVKAQQRTFLGTWSKAFSRSTKVNQSGLLQRCTSAIGG